MKKSTRLILKAVKRRAQAILNRVDSRAKYIQWKRVEWKRVEWQRIGFSGVKAFSGVKFSGVKR